MLFQFPLTIIYDVTDLSVITKIIDFSEAFIVDVPIANPINLPLPKAPVSSRNGLKRKDNDFSFKKSPTQKKTDESAKP